MRKYFKYAIGEILLVVIGILIALQINNWNEDRKASIAEEKALKELLTEFKTNHIDFKRVYKVKKQAKDSVSFYMLLSLDKRIPESKKDILLGNRTGNTTWDPNYAVLNGLFNSGTINNLKNENLKSFLSYWEGHVSNYMRLQDAYDEMAFKYIDLIFTTPDRRENLLGEHNIHSKETVMAARRKLIKSPVYQNQLRLLNIFLGNQLSAMDTIQEKYIQIVTLLEEKYD